MKNNFIDIESDEELIIHMAAGDEAAFTAIYNKYWKLLFFVACKKLGNSSEAEEAVQDIFLDIWQRRSSLVLSSALSSYLSVAVNYRVFKILARRQLYVKYQASGMADKGNTHYMLEPLLDFEEVKTRLYKLTATLPKKCQLVFRMSRENAMTGREIAKQLDISEKTVESHITKALLHLKAGLHLLLLFLLHNFFQ